MNWKGPAAAVLTLCALMACAPDDYPARHIATMRDVHAQLDPTILPGSAVFLGDSLTMALNTSAVAAHAVNYGIGFQRSDELIASMRNYSAVKTASIVYVAIGTNDILQHREAGIEARYREILAAIPAGTPVVLSSPPRLAAGDAATVRDAARRACAARMLCRFVDLYSISAGAQRADGIHLAPSGYQRWIEALH